ncbi:hypothetical protein IGI04_035613, partial [Brassica rapa subsp. trilocularis]
MAHKTTVTNESSVGPYVLLLPRTLSSSSTSIGDFEAPKASNSCSSEMIFFENANSALHNHLEAIEAGDEDGTENDETDVYVGISDKDTIEAGDED